MNIKKMAIDCFWLIMTGFVMGAIMAIGAFL